MADDAGSQEDASLEDEAFAQELIEGLSAPQKQLSSRFLYDARGSELFEQITELEDYYPTRTEAAILDAHAADLAPDAGRGSVMVEYGSGSSRKTEILIRAMPELLAYVPIDVSQSALDDACQRLAQRFPDLDVRPIVGDFSVSVDLPGRLGSARRIGFFPGSTIGNFTRAAAGDLLGQFRASLGGGARLIVGVDLIKDEMTLKQAYDDREGVTAAFNLNILERANRTFGQSFDVGAFRHEARVNREHSRVEMHLVSERQQTVELLGHTFEFRRGETIHTENSHKYSLQGFRSLAEGAGWHVANVFTDERQLFSVFDLAVD